MQEIVAPQNIHSAAPSALYGVAVMEFEFSYFNKESRLFTMYPDSGNFRFLSSSPVYLPGTDNSSNASAAATTSRHAHSGSTTTTSLSQASGVPPMHSRV